MLVGLGLELLAARAIARWRTAADGSPPCLEQEDRDAVVRRARAGLVELIVCDDVDAGLTGLALALELGNVRYEPDFRLQLGRVGVDPEVNLTAAHQMYGELGCVDNVAATEAEMRRQGIRVPTRRRADRFALDGCRATRRRARGGGVEQPADRRATRLQREDDRGISVADLCQDGLPQSRRSGATVRRHAGLRTPRSNDVERHARTAA